MCLFQKLWSDLIFFYVHSDFLKCFVIDIPADTDDLRVFLLICGLRRVKDPLYLVDVFSGRYLAWFPDLDAFLLVFISCFIHGKYFII